jgi:hypothetical protein
VLGGVVVDELLLELGDELEGLVLELELDDDGVLLVSVEVELLELLPDGMLVDGDVVDGAVLGDADGFVVLGVRSPVRSVRLSLQAVSMPRLSATAKMAVSILFISMPPPIGVARPMSEVATAMPPPAA